MPDLKATLTQEIAQAQQAIASLKCQYADLHSQEEAARQARHGVEKHLLNLTARLDVMQSALAKLEEDAKAAAPAPPTPAPEAKNVVPLAPPLYESPETGGSDAPPEGEGD